MKLESEEIRKMSLIEIDEKILELTEELTKHKLNVKVSNETDTSKAKYLRRSIGRLKTIRTQKMEEQKKISDKESNTSESRNDN